VVGEPIGPSVRRVGEEPLMEATMLRTSAPAGRATAGDRIDRRPHRELRLLAVACGVVLGLTACGGASSGAGPSGQSSSATAPSPTDALLAAADTPLGTVLVDTRGRTVYQFAADSPGHSSCVGSCAQYWPPVPAPATLPASLPGVTGTLGSITRADGSRQLTVDGWPLYTYTADTAPGATTGQGVNASGGLWWVVSPAGTAITATSPAAPGSSASTSKAGGGWA
jgi:predicted lipoprotein with Yx(FWY)xxD motif